MFLIFFRSGPIGLVIFLLCIGGMIYLLTKADEIKKRTQRMENEKKP